MLKKSTALSLAALCLCASLAPVSAFSYSDEARAASIQRRAIEKCKERDLDRKIRNVQSRISSNEAEIRRLERKRSELDHKLAVQLQLKEDAYAWYEKVKINREIDRIQSDINWNESRIESLKEKRSSLDHELAVLLQLKEV